MSHQKEKRQYLYTPEELETAKTHDPYWNAAQKQMVIEGKIHGYMRMYWGRRSSNGAKRLKRLFRSLLPSIINTSWMAETRMDLPAWPGVLESMTVLGERPVFGNVRYMNDKGLRRKFDADGYVKRMDASGGTAL